MGPRISLQHKDPRIKGILEPVPQLQFNTHQSSFQILPILDQPSETETESRVTKLALKLLDRDMSITCKI